MKSNAPGQYLGYAIQSPRALYHLLESGPGCTVCIEVLGDVARITENGNVFSEEDKSSIAKNPLTNKSTDLWKTFANWIRAIKSNELSLGKTKFILFTNQPVKKGIITVFNLAKTKKEADEAIEYARNILIDIKADHKIWSDYNYVVNQNQDILIEIIMNFELQYDKKSGFKEIEIALKKKLFPSSSINTVIELCMGWLSKLIIGKIRANEKAIIQWEEFQKKFLVIFNRIRLLELIDFTKQFPVSEEEIKKQVKTHPNYIKQLDLINIHENELLEAVTDFLKADINRTKWIENETIDYDTTEEFEDNLLRSWKNIRNRIELVHKSLTEEERGKLILETCKDKNIEIRNMTPPAFMISGTFHALANVLALGWHPKWEKHLTKNSRN